MKKGAHDQLTLRNSLSTNSKKSPFLNAVMPSVDVPSPLDVVFEVPLSLVLGMLTLPQVLEAVDMSVDTSSSNKSCITIKCEPGFIF
jgi:hypothetical protein